MSRAERGPVLDRRQFIKLAAGVTAYSAVRREFPPDLAGDTRALIEKAGLGLEYAPEIIAAAVNDPQGLIDTLGLFLPPNESYMSSYSLIENYSYLPSSDNVILAFGDSNMLGKGTDSPATLFCQEVIERHKGDLNVNEWRDFVFAESGAKIERVKEQISSPEAIEKSQISDKCDIWVNAGGNDLIQIADSLEKLKKLQDIGEDPLKHPSLLLEFGKEAMSVMSEFEGKFAGLLDTIHDVYGPKIRHITIMSLPDFSKAQALVSYKFRVEEEPYRLPINDPRINDLARNISIRVNNEMFDAISRYKARNPDVRIVGIDTFEESDFNDDQHFSEEARHRIAVKAADRVLIGDTS